MWTAPSAAWTVRGATFALWALAAASAAYWGLRLGTAAPGPRIAPVPARQVAAVDPEALARMLGSAPAAPGMAPAAPSLASRFQLLGVAAGAQSGGGAAVIAVDGKPGRPYRVGAPVEEGLVLLSVHGRQALLGPAGGPPQLTLELPPLPQPAQSASAAPR